MDIYMIASIVIILVVIIAVIAAGRLYQKVRRDTGYHQGKFYMRKKGIGIFRKGYQERNKNPGKEYQKRDRNFPKRVSREE